MRQVDRFGYVKRAQHGTRMLSWAELRATYGRELVKLANESRYTFLNTLFSVSEAVMYMQARKPARQPGYQLKPWPAHLLTAGLWAELGSGLVHAGRAGC